MPSYGLREFPNVLTKEECDLIIKYSKPLLKRCEVIDEDSKKIRQTGDYIQNDNRVNNILLPVRDGLMICTKK